MKPQIRFLQFTVACEVFAEKGKWWAKSDSLGSVASAETPEAAMKKLKDEIQRSENEEARARRSRLAEEAKERAEEAKKAAAERKAFEKVEAEKLEEETKLRVDAEEQGVKSEEDSKTGEAEGAETEQEFEGEDFSFDDDDAPEGESLIDTLTGADIATLRQIAEENGVDHEGVGKVALRERLIEELTDE